MASLMSHLALSLHFFANLLLVSCSGIDPSWPGCMGTFKGEVWLALQWVLEGKAENWQSQLSAQSRGGEPSDQRCLVPQFSLQIWRGTDAASILGDYKYIYFFKSRTSLLMYVYAFACLLLLLILSELLLLVLSLKPKYSLGRNLNIMCLWHIIKYMTHRGYEHLNGCGDAFSTIFGNNFILFSLLNTTYFFYMLSDPQLRHVLSSGLLSLHNCATDSMFTVTFITQKLSPSTRLCPFAMHYGTNINYNPNSKKVVILCKIYLKTECNDLHIS